MMIENMGAGKRKPKKARKKSGEKKTLKQFTQVTHGFGTINLKWPIIKDYKNGAVFRQHNKRIALLKKEKEGEEGYCLNITRFVDKEFAAKVKGGKLRSVFSTVKRDRLVVNEIHLKKESIEAAVILYLRQCGAQEKMKIIETAITGNPMYPFDGANIMAFEYKWEKPKTK